MNARDRFCMYLLTFLNIPYRWGGANPLQGLDCSRMNLAEFYAEIAPTLPDVGAMRSRAQQKINSYYGP